MAGQEVACSHRALALWLHVQEMHDASVTARDRENAGGRSDDRPAWPRSHVGTETGAVHEKPDAVQPSRDQRPRLQGHLHIAGSQEDDSDAEEEAELLAVSELD